jgi:non-heme chloroperoxidase
VARYIGRHGESRVAKAVLISAVTPSVLRTEANPAGVPQAAFEGLQAQLAANRSEFYRVVPSGPFYNFDQPGAEPSEAIIANWWRQGMMGGAKGQYECVFAFIREDYTSDLKKISVPVLVMHGDADQIVPYATAAPRAVELVQNGTLKTYKDFPHGTPTTHADTINADLRGPSVAVRGNTDGAHRPFPGANPVRHASVDTATQRSTAPQGDTPRDTEETAR